MTNLIPLSDWLRQAPDRPVATGPGGLKSYSDLTARVTFWCGMLTTSPGQRWAVYHQDTFEFAALLLALWQKGCTACVPGDNLPATVTRLKGRVSGFVGDFPTVRCLPDDAGSPPAGGRIWQRLPRDFVAIEVYTSGSTGTPKPIGKTFYQLESELATIEARWPAENDAILLATVTHQHFYGLVFRLLWPLCKGQVFEQESCRFSEDIFRLAQQYPHFCLVSTPSHLGRLSPTLDWATLRSRCQAVFSSAAPLRLEDSLRVAELLGVPVREIYGSSETGAIAWRIQDRTQEAEWEPLPGIGIESTRAGTLQVTARQVTDACQVLSDRVLLNRSGRFRLLGRADRIAKIEGKRISLAEVEQVAEQHAWIKQARALVLVRRRTEVALVAELTNEGVRYLQSEGKRALIRTLREAFRLHFEPVALPRRWRFVEQMPYNRQGKITMSSLTELFQPERVEWPDMLNLAHSGDRLEMVLKIPKNLIYFEGHFPENPVLPGVTQLHWAVCYAQKHFGVALRFYQLEAIKFQQVIFPGDTVRLNLEYSTAKNKLLFTYESDRGKHSSGRICFD